MKNILKIENAAFFTLGLWAFSLIGISWWWFVAFFFVPDISMLGYLINNKAGTFFYNLFHHLAVALLVWGIGHYFNLIFIEAVGAILFAHSAFDRVLGYGLKYSKRFNFTHLGVIGKIKNEND